MLRRLFAVPAALLVLLCAIPSLAATRTLVVYPFAVSGTAPEELGKQVSDQIAAEIGELGGITIVHGAASAKPADYRAAAKALGADYYFSGSIAPVFNRYSAIEQLVSTRSGTVMWGVSIQFRTVADIAGEGRRIHDELVRGDATPPPGIAASGVSLVTPSPVSPSPGSPSPLSPSVSGYAVLPVTGSAASADKTFATSAIVTTLQRHGYNVVTVTSAAPIDPATEGAAACAKTGARALVAGALDTARVSTGPSPQTNAHIDLRTFDCRTRALDLQSTVVNHIAPVGDDAIRGAIEDAVSAFPAPS
jgi:TolB-like protein